MTVVSLAAAAVFFVSPPVLILGLRRARRMPLACTSYFAEWAIGAAGGAAGATAGRDWLETAAFGASGALGLILWWLSRRRRKRSLKALGSKARARLAAMARNMPRPAPRLVPRRTPA